MILELKNKADCNMKHIKSRREAILLKYLYKILKTEDVMIVGRGRPEERRGYLSYHVWKSRGAQPPCPTLSTPMGTRFVKTSKLEPTIV